MLHTKFRGNRPPVPEKKIFDGFYHIGAWRPSWSYDKHHVIRFALPESFHTKFVLDRHSCFWGKSSLNFCMYMTGPRSRNDLDLQYSHIFIIFNFCY